MTKRFLRSMAQPFEHDQTGVSLWTLEDVENRQAAVRAAAEGGRMLSGPDETRDPAAEAEAEGWYEGFEDADIMAIEEAELEASSGGTKKKAVANAGMHAMEVDE